MPKNSLYSIVTGLANTGADVVLNQQIETLFENNLIQNGINYCVANAMANVIGLDKKSWFRLWEVKKNPAQALSSSAGYFADDVTRYFFEYSTESNSPVTFLEYSRFETYEIRGSRKYVNGWKELKLSDAQTKEAICAMLFAIMQEEGNNSNFVMMALKFSKEYQSMFLGGPNQGMELIKLLFDELKSNVDPKNTETEAPFSASSTFLNASNGRLKEILQNETIGYKNGDDGMVYLSADMQARLCKEGGNVKDVPISFVVMEGVLKTATSRNFSIEENQFPIRADREYNADDRSRLLTIPDWYVPVPAIYNIAKAVSGSTMFKKPFRNILMRGPAGSGKTEGAKALASMFGSPYGVVTGHAEMEFFDLTSNLFPNTDSAIQTDGEMYDYLMYALRENGMKLPSFIEIASMPDILYQKITGVTNEEAGENECFVALVAKLMSVCKSDATMFGGENSKFKVIHSDLTQGFQKGWLVELQEMNTILKPGVLVGLNNILEHGQLRLPTGEVINRHPDTIVVFTQNVGYAGTTDGNQSVYSRVEVKCELNHPSEDEMVDRIVTHVPEISEADCRTIVQAVMRVHQNCAAEIEGGSVGTREAINWAKMTVLLGGDMREAAELTVLPSVGEDPDDIQLVRTNIHQSVPELGQ